MEKMTEPDADSSMTIPNAIGIVLVCLLALDLGRDMYDTLVSSDDSPSSPGSGAGSELFDLPLPGSDVTPRPDSTVAETHVELPSDVTSQQESSRVDPVLTDHLDWKHCTPGVDGLLARSALLQLQQKDPAKFSSLQCAEHHVPVNYAYPKQGTLTLKIIRRVADEPEKRLGSVFVHPGGPGLSGAPMLYSASKYFSQDVLESFDLVAVESRGVDVSSEEDCVENASAVKKERTFFGPLRTEEERKQFERRAGSIATRCSGLSNDIARHGSTANTVRDIEVVRQAVGDEKLSFYGFSYGTVVGQTYADMFPDRVRVMALDGMVNNPDWYGTDSNSDENLLLRTQSAQAVDETLTELMARCDAATETECVLAARPGSSLDAYLYVKEKLKENPVPVGQQYTNNNHIIDDRAFTVIIRALMRNADTVDHVPVFIDGFIGVVDANEYVRSQKVGKLLEEMPEQLQTYRPGSDASSTTSGLGLLPEAPATNVGGLMVVCSEVARPDYETAVARANNHPWMLAGGGLGLAYIECSHSSWTFSDQDRFTGPMGARTSAPLLIVGNYGDPVTSYRQAEKAAARIPHNYLVLSDNWGHGAAPNSPCMRCLIGDYLLTGEQPEHGRCFAPQPLQ